MAGDERKNMTRSRGLITFTERDRIAGKTDVENAKRYQAVSRVRRRIKEELPEEIKLLEQHNPDLRDELHVVAAKTPRLPESVPAYVFVKNYSTTGEHEILYDGERINRLNHNGSGEAQISWGYSGRGSHNAVYSVLTHAAHKLGLELRSLSTADRNKFRRKYFQRGEESEWAIPFSEVQIWIQQNDLDTNENPTE